MSEHKSPHALPPGGLIQNTLEYFKVALRLMVDRRVSLWLKLIPIAAIGYMISWADAFIPYVDDAGIFGLAIFVFVEMCPPEVVAEHRRVLRGSEAPPAAGEAEEKNVIDGSFRDQA